MNGFEWFAFVILPAIVGVLGWAAAVIGARYIP